MVPEGWTTEPLHEVTSKNISYGIVQTGEAVPGGIPCVRVIDLSKRRMARAEMITTTEEINHTYRKTILESREIMLALRGEIGLVRMVDDDLQGCNLTRGIARIAADHRIVEPEYLLWAVRSPSFRSSLMKRVNGSALREIPINELKKIPVPVPPLHEQRRIAEILSAWDRAIETVELLVDNSERLKRSVLQQLTKSAHPQRVECLSGIADVLVSNVDKKSRPDEQPVRLCNYTDVYYNEYITADLGFMSATATPSQIKKFSLKKGDIVITKDSETPDDIAVPAMVAEDLDGVLCGYHLAIIRPYDDVDSAYLSALFSLRTTRHYFFTRANGATRFGLPVGAIENAVFALPSLAEQRAVAQTLAACERSVHAYREQLVKLRLERKALMQQLLTGKRRVRLDETEGQVVIA